MTERKTQEIDQLSVIRGLLSDLTSKVDSRLGTIDAKVDAHRAEGAQRGAEQTTYNQRLEVEVAWVRKEVHRLSVRVSHHDEALRELREEDATRTRQQSESDLETQAAIGGAIAHMTTIDEGFAEVRANDAVQNRVDRAICEELGLDYVAIAEPGDPRDSKPDDGKRVKRTKLTQLVRENKGSLGASIAAAVLVALQFALEWYSRHPPH